ncbi:hypothetical protein [Flavobacterium sp. ov086]|uniref:hypothetical protein n=1 Tax=Flavobacterium sp. ov086 TaxID=1761785 RepID=UPI000B6B0F67|nr:hypothetical protein [Flavobacterium sp. ov086]SNR51431.1 hypothetical protein SAMN04487979_10926 [Flavobacterium sp. ov086]
MKWLFTLVFSFLSLGICAQQKNNHTIKIYLEDAERGRNIDDAKVTLEGFEIPAITSQYDKKGKYYYFDKIPTGYNTVMAYHKKYNEKGFQNVEGLPEELKLKLYNPLNVSYSFESETFKSSTQNVYVEDSYKIAIFPTDQENYNLFKDYIKKEISKLNLEIEIINPYFELEKNKNIPYIFRNDFSPQKEAYPFIKNFNILRSTDFILPLIKGYSTSEYYEADDRGYEINSKQIAFYIRKTNSQKFKRFNDPFLKKINTIKGIKVASVIYYKYYFNDRNKKKTYKNHYTKNLDRQNYFTNIDSSKVFFYYNFHNVDIMKKPNRDQFGMSVLKYYPVPNQFLIFPWPDMFNKYEEHIKTDKTQLSMSAKQITDLDKSIGLGILDQYEKISDSLKQKFSMSDMVNNYEIN